MKKVTCFYLEKCPYCIQAKKALDELIDENPDYGQVEIDWIEESRNPEIIDQIQQEKSIDDELTLKMKEVMKAFVENFLKVNKDG